MKVLIDLIGTQPKDFSTSNGGSEYCKATLYFLVEKNEHTSSITVLFLKPYPVDTDLSRFLSAHPLVKQHYLESIKDLENYLLLEKFNTIFCGLNPNTYNNVKIPNCTKFVLTDHGLRRVETKIDKWYYNTEKPSLRTFAKYFLSTFFPHFYLKLAVKTRETQFHIAKNIEVFTDSQHSKAAILLYYPFLKGKIHIGYPPMKVSFSKVISNQDFLSANKLLPKKYILMISGNRGEKNCLRGAVAFDNLVSKKLIPDDIKLVILGLKNSKVYLDKIKNKKRFSFFGYIPSSELELLYKEAHLFLYPSVNEGFGYPPLEAMKYHTLVATSAITSIPEVCQNAVLYFNPYSLPEIEERIIQSFDKIYCFEILQRIDATMSYVSRMQNSGLVELNEVVFKQ
jgi:glycosyltransferase involved in cell wall biosynthesis